MTSPSRVRANRLNALRSTGPRTTEGKQRSSFNALRLGLFVKHLAMPALGEDAGDAEAFRRAVLADLAPAGAVETELAERAAALMWRLRRITRGEATALAASLGPLPPDPAEVGSITEPYRPVPPEAPTAYKLGRSRADLAFLNGNLEWRREELALLDDGRETGELVLMSGYRVLWAAQGELGWASDPWPAVLARLGFGRVGIREVRWKLGDVYKVLAALADEAGRDRAQFLEAVRERLRGAIGDTERQLEGSRAEEARLAAQLLRERTEAAAAKLYANESVAQPLARAESHLMAQLQKALDLLAKRQLTRRAEGQGVGFVLPGGAD